MGPLEFIAGFGQMRQQVHAQEAGLKDKATQQLWGGIGQGVGNAVMVPAQAYLADRAGDRQLGNALALQQARFGVPADMPDLMSRHAALFGGNGQAPAPAPPTFDQGFGDTTGGYGVSLPDQGMSQQFPISAPPGADPQVSAARATKAQQEYDSLDEKYKKFMAQPMTPMEQAGGMRMFIPALERARAYAQANPPPKQPTTAEELRASGEVIEEPGTYNYWTRDSKGARKLSTAAHPIAKPGTYPGPNGERLEFQPNSVYSLPDGTRVVTDDTGTPNIEAKGSGTSTKPIDYRKEAATRVKTPEGADEPTSTESVVKEYEQEKQTAFALEISDHNATTITRDEYIALGDKIEAQYGPDPGKVPRDVWNAYYELGSRFRKTIPHGDFGD